MDAAVQQLCFDNCANPNYKDVVLKVGECVYMFIPQAAMHMLRGIFELFPLSFTE